MTAAARESWRGLGRRACRLILACSLLIPVAAEALPTYETVRAAYAASDIQVLDRSGMLLDRVRADFQSRRGNWLDLNDISIAMQRAVILSEDRRFYQHGGVDMRAIASAAWDNLVHGGHRGASTLSMQLLGLIDPHFRRGPDGRSLVQKADQALEAVALEAQWSKSQILEAYLNLAPFHGELIGIDALARVMFQKQASGLNARESALSAVFLRGPNAPEATLVERTCALLREMGVPSECKGLSDFVYMALQHGASPWVDNLGLASHYARLALLRSPVQLHAGQAVRTTLDGALQRFAVNAVSRRLRALGMANVRDAAVVVQDNRTGEILAYVGSSGSLSDAPLVDHARALRQAGSALKPFLYEQALAQKRLTAVSLLHDSPLNLDTGNGLYIPQNYDAQFAGWVSVRTALASSLNIPAVRVLIMVTPDAFARSLVALGLPLDRSGDYYGYSLALGSADITLLSLTNAYRALANLGLYSAPRFTLAAQEAALTGKSTTRIMAPGATWIVGDILSDRQARARTFGLDSALSTPFWTAVKTGTSKDMRDNWCLGWSERYTVGVWVGNSGGASMHDVSGVSGAGPIWHDVMSYLHRGLPSNQPQAPASVHRQMVTFQDGIEPARLDVFLDDTEVGHVRLAQSFSLPGGERMHIVRPADGAILAMDPDIPWKNQRLWLQASNIAGGKTGNARWRVDGRPVGEGSAVPWPPRPGRHRLDLFDAEGRLADTAHIEVRAAMPRQARAGTNPASETDKARSREP